MTGRGLAGQEALPGRGRPRRARAARAPRPRSAHGERVGLLDLVGAHPPLGSAGGAAGGAGVLHELAGAAVEHAAEVAGLADRPGQRGGAQADLLVDAVHQLERRQAGPVPLVDHGHHRDAAQRAHLEQLERLRLEPLAGVDEHDGGVDGGEHAVGVLGEVAVAGGVDEVDHVVAVDELQRGRGDRDAACLLHRHPVRDRGAAVALAVDGSGLGDHPRVQGERLGEGRLARVGVADDGERTAWAGVGHRPNLPAGAVRRRFGDVPAHAGPAPGPPTPGAVVSGRARCDRWPASRRARAPAGARDRRAPRRGRPRRALLLLHDLRERHHRQPVRRSRPATSRSAPRRRAASWRGRRRRRRARRGRRRAGGPARRGRRPASPRSDVRCAPVRAPGVRPASRAGCRRRRRGRATRRAPGSADLRRSCRSPPRRTRRSARKRCTHRSAHAPSCPTGPRSPRGGGAARRGPATT